MKLKYAWIGLACLLTATACFKSKPKEGVQVTLQVMTDDVLGLYTDESIFRLKELLERKNILVGSLKRGLPGQFLVEGYSPGDEGNIRDILDENIKDWNLTAADGTASVSLKHEASRNIRNEAMDQTLAILRKRLDSLNVSDPFLERLPKDRINIEMRGVNDETDRILGLLTTGAYLEWKLVQAGPAQDEESLLKGYGGQVPDDMQVLPADPKRMESGYYLVNRVAGVTGRDLSSVQLTRDDWDNPAVLFKLTPEGSRRFARLTGENIGRQVAIILDGKVQSSPVVQSQISDRGIIQGRFTQGEVEDLVTVLRSGGLPAGVKILEVRAFND